jgi:type I restriction enzyme S subunit
MASKWREATFQQLIDEGLLEIGDGYRAQNNELGGSGPIFLRAGHVTDSHIDFSGVEHFHEHLASKVRSKMSKVGDTIITTKGNSTGRTSFVTDQFPQFVYSPHLSYWRSREPEKLCAGFLRYWSQGVEFIEQLTGMKASTDMAPYLSLTDQRRLFVTLPPLEVQEAIASMLGALDDKIELNRRMNETLEALAQTIFKSWFVDAAATKLPKGWRAGTLGELVELRADRVEATPAKDKERYIALEDMPSKCIDLSNHQLGSAVNSSIIRFQAGDILFGSMRPYFHKVGLASFDGITRTTTFVLRPKQDRLRHFALFHFFSNEVVEFATTASIGTTIPYVKWDSLGRYKIVLPPESLLEEFENTVAPLVQRIARNGEESRTLAELRDALLPKLLSGELRVPVKAE